MNNRYERMKTAGMASGSTSLLDFNDRTYPTLVKLFEEFGIATVATGSHILPG